MISIYKKLPGTNCGRCGMPTCMVFAMKVKKSLANLSDCPSMPGEILPGPAPAPVASSFSSYEQVSDELQRETVSLDFRETAEAIGGTYESCDGRESILLKMINKAYKLTKEGLFENDAYCGDSWTKIIVFDYLRKKGTMPLTGYWITLGHFPNTASHVKAFQSSAERKIAERFKKDVEGLKRRCQELGGIETEGKVKADYIYRFNLLPHVPLYLSFWAADEEFDADCRLMFDSGAEGCIDIEYLAYLVERFVAELVGNT
jgi:hypothetical protein